MNINKILVFFIILFFCWMAPAGSNDIKDIKGWGETRWGMTEDQIIAAPGDRVKRIGKPHKYQTGISYLIIEELPIGAYKFRVDFIMDHETNLLVQVNLSNIEKKIYDTAFYYIEKLLIDKYGDPGYKNDRRRPVKSYDVTKLDRAWYYPSTQIELSYFASARMNDYRLVILYKDKNKKLPGSDKL